MKKYVNDPDDPKMDSQTPVPRFIYDELKQSHDELVAALERYIYGNGPDNPYYAHLTVGEAKEILARLTGRTRPVDRQEESR
jgi:hypothetical protein